MKFKLTRSVLIASLLMVCPFFTYAQDKKETVEYKYKTASGDTDEVDAVMRFPNEKGNKRAIVILHDGGGWMNERTIPYAKMFAANGYVTLEPRMFRSPGQWEPKDDLSKAFGALEFLSKRPDVDPNSIYVMGQSWGAMLTLAAASERLNQKMNHSKTKFKAHASLYPVCWSFIPKPNKVDGMYKHYDKDDFTNGTGAPVKIFVGTLDDYDNRDPDTCNRMISRISDEKVRKQYSVVKYEGATHGWDHGETYTFYSKTACKGEGCENTNESNAEITRRGMQDVLDFFKAN